MPRERWLGRTPCLAQPCARLCLPLDGRGRVLVGGTVVTLPVPGRALRGGQLLVALHLCPPHLCTWRSALWLSQVVEKQKLAFLTAPASSPAPSQPDGLPPPFS